MAARKNFTTAAVRRVGKQIGIDWASAPFDAEHFRRPIEVRRWRAQRSSLPGVVGQEADLEAVVELELHEHA
jgi:hypothetical protein